MSEHQTIEKPTDYFSYSGKRAKQMTGVTVCVILKIEGVVFRSWHLQNLSTWPRLVPTRDLESYLKLVQTQADYKIHIQLAGKATQTLEVIEGDISHTFNSESNQFEIDASGTNIHFTITD